MTRKTCALWMTASILAGCAGGQTGDLSGNTDLPGDQGGNEASGQCDETVVALATLDEVTSLGFSAADVLTFAAGEVQTPMAWSSSDQVTFVPASGRGTLDLEVRYEGGAAEYVASRPKSGSGGENIGSNGVCADRVRIAVQVALRTADGGLDETFETKLEAASAHVATFSQPLEPTALTGSFEVTSVPPNGKVKQFGIAATLTPFGVSGSISSVLEVHQPASNAVSARWITYASWPDSPACAGNRGPDGFPVSIDAPVLGVTGAAAVAAYNSESPLDLRWRDGSQAALTLAVTSRGDGCVRSAMAGVSTPFEVTYPVRLRATTSDGRLDGAYDSELHVRSDEKGEIVYLATPTGLVVAPDNSEASGLSGLGDVSRFDSLSFWLNSEIVAGVTSGFLQINGISPAPAATPPGSEPGGGSGSPGSQPTTIERASWE